MIRGCVTAFRTLTVLPIPGRDSEKMASALPWFPAVGLTLGLVLYGVVILFYDVLGVKWPEGVAAILVAVGALLTGCLHLDGLSDWADGFGGGRDRDRVLGIMKDSHVGAFGVVTTVCVLLVKWACFARLVDMECAGWIIAAYVVSRTIQVDLAVSMPYARSVGGTAGPFVADARGRHLITAMLLAGILLLAACGLRQMLIAVLGGWLIGRWFSSLCRRRVGGVTGDLLGACSEIVETTILLAGAVLSGV